ncbi:ABC transporter permease [Thalassotalea euphylliae]|uniref:Transport permease protein n=1 Tax=Thalassotalea euphylliae TaxID=1655234 RepID=A0A3E0TZT1_9GAMM|nr:ABC transporter permease [Thalassotalea euphylliae]REL30201.1 ABC transporter permease [Thalassotalea euphylliae]
MNRSFKQLTEVYFTQLVFNLKTETRKTYLNYLWWVLEPAMISGVFYLVFAVFLNRGTDNFLLFLLCGKIPFLWFSKTVSNASNSIIAGKGLIHQLVIPKAYFPLLVVGQDFVKQIFVFLFLFAFVAFLGGEVSQNWLYILPVILTQLLLVTGFSLLVAAITPFLPDFRFIISTGMMMLMFGSGIFYSYKDVILTEHQELFLLNPIANLLKNYREVLLDNSVPDFYALGTITMGSAVLILLVTMWFKRHESTYARVVIQ